MPAPSSAAMHRSLKNIALLTAALCVVTASPSRAQPIESEPLGPAPYTLKNETDPMALGAPPAATPDQAIQPAPDFAPLPAADAAAQPPMEITPPAMPPEQPADAQTAPSAQAEEPPPHVVSYPRSNVSGIPPQDPSKFEKMVFCTLKVSFGSFGPGVDSKSGEAIKAYLDDNASKLTYTRKNWGKEGEYDYCIMVQDHKNKAEIYKGLKALIPADGKSRGPVTLSGDGFATVSTNKKNRE